MIGVADDRSVGRSVGRSVDDRWVPRGGTLLVGPCTYPWDANMAVLTINTAILTMGLSNVQDKTTAGTSLRTSLRTQPQTSKKHQYSSDSKILRF